MLEILGWFFLHSITCKMLPQPLGIKQCIKHHMHKLIFFGWCLHRSKAFFIGPYLVDFCIYKPLRLLGVLKLARSYNALMWQACPVALIQQILCFVSNNCILSLLKAFWQDGVIVCIGSINWNLSQLKFNWIQRMMHWRFTLEVLNIFHFHN